ncbi:hypothetical protein, partial [Cohnella sp.]|uniref:hypothetical protein n=1 Tax=Cohnella sp. TaxID=1883426 RepID=UPI003566351D
MVGNRIILSFSRRSYSKVSNLLPLIPTSRSSEEIPRCSSVDQIRLFNQRPFTRCRVFRLAVEETVGAFVDEREHVAVKSEASCVRSGDD